jgi:hypothetical protein
MQFAGTLRKSDAVHVPPGQFGRGYGANAFPGVMARRAAVKAPHFGHRIAAT